MEFRISWTIYTDVDKISIILLFWLQLKKYETEAVKNNRKNPLQLYFRYHLRFWNTRIFTYFQHAVFMHLWACFTYNFSTLKMLSFLAINFVNSTASSVNSLFSINNEIKQKAIHTPISRYLSKFTETYRILNCQYGYNTIPIIYSRTVLANNNFFIPGVVNTGTDNHSQSLKTSGTWSYNSYVVPFIKYNNCVK